MFINAAGNFAKKALRLSRELRRFFSLGVFVEVLVTNLISLFPLGAIGLIASVKNSTEGGLLEAIVRPLSTGQLFLYCFSTLASVLWILFDVGGRPIRILIGPIALMLLLYTTLLIGVDPQMVSLANPTIIRSSYYVYFASVVLHYFVLSVAKASPPTVTDSLKTGVEDLESEVSELEQSLRSSNNG